MRKLLILTYHFPPSAASGSFRLLGFAQHLPKFGWQTAVVSPPALRWEPTDQSLLDKVPRETVVDYVPYPGRLPKAVRWLAPWAVWLPWGLRAALRAVRRERPDAVLTSGPSHWVHVLGLFLKRWHKLPWIADFRDPWITALGQGGGFDVRAPWQRLWERTVMHRADIILANAPNACRTYQAAYPAAADRMVTLTNGYDPDLFDGLAASKTPGGPLQIVHAGQLYAGRDPRPFLDALVALRGDATLPPFRARFLGRNESEGFDFADEVRSRGVCDLVELPGHVSYRQSLEVLCRADILLLLDSPGRRIGVPAKLYEYMGTGRPLLALAEEDGDVALVLKQSGLPHRIAPPGDVAKIQQGLVELMRETASGHATAAPEKLHRFTREANAGRLATMLNGLVPTAQSAVAPALLACGEHTAPIG